MSRNFVILAVVALVVGSLALTAGVAQATPLTINNASFEQNNYSAQSTGWTSFGPSGTQAVGWTGYWSSANGAQDYPVIMNNSGNPYNYPTPYDGTHVLTLRGTSSDHACVIAQELTTNGTTAYEFANVGDTLTMSIYA